MAQKNIPRNEWPDFCKSFSEQHQGWLVTLTDVHPRKVKNAVPEAHVVARNLRLRQISAERDGHHVGLRIVAGDGSGRITHLVLDPARIDIEKTGYGRDRGLRISDVKNQSTVVRFNVPQIS